MAKDKDQKFLTAMLNKGNTNAISGTPSEAEASGESKETEKKPVVESKEVEESKQEKTAEVLTHAQVSISTSEQIPTSIPVSMSIPTPIPTPIEQPSITPETPIVPISRAIPTPPKNHNSKNPDETRSKRTSFLVRPSVFEKIREVVIKKKISLNDAVEEALLDYYEKHKG